MDTLKIDKLRKEYLELSDKWYRKLMDCIDYSKPYSTQEKDIVKFLNKTRRIEELFKSAILYYDARAKLVPEINNFAELEFNYSHPIPSVELNNFFNNIKIFKKLVLNTKYYKQEIERIKKRKDDINGFMVVPFVAPLGNRVKKIDTRNIQNNVAKIDKRMHFCSSKIKLKYLGKHYSGYSTPIKKTGRVEIFLPKRGYYSRFDVLTYVHELGHAMDMIEKMNSNIWPFKRESYFIDETNADKLRFKYIMKYFTDEEKEKYMSDMLNDITLTLFQMDIFNNPKQDYAQAFAHAVNSVYPDINQKRNPLYYFLCYWAVTQPLLSAAHTINMVKFFIRNNKKYERNIST